MPSHRLIGSDMQAVIVTLDRGETVIAEAGVMMYMQGGIVMETTLDPNAQGGGLLGKLVAGAKRALSGDSFFMTTFTNRLGVPQEVAFAAPYPGKIREVALREWGGSIIAQRNAFLCADRGVGVTVTFTRKLGAGFFGGEGFILQRLQGEGTAFLHACGALHEMQLAAGEVLRVDTGCVVAMDAGVDFDIELVPGVKAALFGGEGLFFARLTGPGRVILQTLPFSRLADRIIAAAPREGGSRTEEATSLGAVGLGALGAILDRDR